MRDTGRAKTIAGYALMILAAYGVFTVIRGAGEHIIAPPLPEGAQAFGTKGSAKGGADILVHILIAMSVVIVTARVVGAAFKYIHQPAVMGEVIAGIMLGPSLLGRISPEAYAFVLPQNVAPYLGTIAQVGVILFMFLVGLELDTKLLRTKTHATVAISHASIIAPFLLGSLTALFLYPRLATSDVPFTVFALFSGVSMSVTAFPVLARILTDRKIQKTKLGVVAISCAAVDDVTAWCLLAFVVGYARSNVDNAFYTILLSVGFVAFMLLVVRPFMERVARRPETTRTATFAVYLGIFLSALATESIGIHALFGAFLFGSIIPHDSPLAERLHERLESVVVLVFLPAFFAFTGMRTQIGLISGLSSWAIFGLIVLVACAGKFGGSLVAAKLVGQSWRDSASIGILMNTRGLMELIVLNLGLELKILSPTLFAMLVLMAIVTTFMTTPLLHLLTKGQTLEEPTLIPGVSRAT